VRRDLLDRDAGVCWICGGDVDLTVAPTAPGAPTVDHVVPRALGGGNDPANLRLAHRRCNGRRGSALPELDWPAGIVGLERSPLWPVARAALQARHDDVVDGPPPGRRNGRRAPGGFGTAEAAWQTVGVFADRADAAVAGRWAVQALTAVTALEWRWNARNSNGFAVLRVSVHDAADPA
jgi:hypothetical protein